jgi:hypothetical protein
VFIGDSMVHLLSSRTAPLEGISCELLIRVSAPAFYFRNVDIRRQQEFGGRCMQFLKTPVALLFRQGHFL